MADPYLVGTITKLSDSNWIGHRTVTFGNPEDTFTGKTFPECKTLIEACLGRRLIEQWVEGEGVPTVVYLRIPCAEIVYPNIEDVTGGGTTLNVTGTNMDSFQTFTVIEEGTRTTYDRETTIDELGVVVNSTTFAIPNSILGDIGPFDTIELANCLGSSSFTLGGGG